MLAAAALCLYLEGCVCANVFFLLEALELTWFDWMVSSNKFGHCCFSAAVLYQRKQIYLKKIMKPVYKLYENCYR